MSKKIKKSSGKKVKSAKPAKKAKAKKVFANKKNAVKKAGKKAAPAKKAAPSKKPIAKAKPVKTTGKLKAKPKTAAKKPAGKPISKVVAKTVVKAVNTMTSAPKTTEKPGTTAKAKKEVLGNKKAEIKKPAAEITAQSAKNTSASIKSNPASNNKPAQALKTAAKAVVVDDAKSSNDPPGKFELEYVIHSSAELLFNFLTEPSGLSEWFCDDVNIRHGIYTFFWDGSQQQAKEIKFIPDRCIRFQWVEKHDGTYFEFRIEKDELTSDISLIITDFAESEDDRKSLKLLWDSQIDKLLHVMGAYF